MQGTLSKSQTVTFLRQSILDSEQLYNLDYKMRKNQKNKENDQIMSK